MMVVRTRVLEVLAALHVAAGQAHAERAYIIKPGDIGNIPDADAVGGQIAPNL